MRSTLFINFRQLGATGALVASSFGASQAWGADVAVVSGFFERTSQKIDGSNRGTITKFSTGGRYTDDLSTNTALVVEGDLNFKTYSAASGVSSPDNSFGLSFKGGMRYYFKPFSASVVPYVTGLAGLKNDKSASWTGVGYEEVTQSGLYYGVNTGIRAGLGEKVFVEVELPFFESPLFTVTKTERTSTVAGTASSKEEVTENALYFKSEAKLTEIKIGLGMKL